MKPETARNKRSATLFVTLITLGSAGAIAEFQGIDSMLPSCHHADARIDTHAYSAFLAGNEEKIPDSNNLRTDSRLLESGFKGDAQLYTLGLDFLANNYLAVRSRLERWLNLDSPALTIPMHNGAAELNGVYSGMRFVF